jgi:hypothetical protein
VDIPEDGHVVSYRASAMAAVSIVEDAHSVASLHIDNRQQEGSNATLYADARQAVLPLLLHPAPRRALFLGLGTGITAASAAEDLMLEVDAVELLPEVTANASISSWCAPAWPARRCRTAQPSSGSANDLALLGSFVAGPSGLLLG